MNTLRQHDLSNQRIDGYLFIRKLGSGGFADVYLAEEQTPTPTHRKVAIKIFGCEEDNRSGLRAIYEHFRGDLEPLIRLSNTTPIVQYYATVTSDIVMQDGHVTTLSGLTPGAPRESVFTIFMIVMEYADGGTLADNYRDSLLNNDNWTDFYSHMADVCDALNAMHGEGIIHRDIKPSNLFYFEKVNRVKVGDLGLAAVEPTQLLVDNIRGSLAYMSPESFRGAAEPARDIYALGVTLYELLSGVLPFEASFDNVDRLAAWRDVHSNASRPDVIARNRRVSVPLNKLLKRMMAPESEDRPTLREVREQLLRERDWTSVSVEHVLEDAKGRDIRRLSGNPVVLSRYLIHPHFRKLVLQETLYFVFVSIEFANMQKLQMMFELLERHFHAAYSCTEVFGKYDFVIRAWCGMSSRVVTSFCRAMIDQVLNCDETAIKVFACEEVTYVGADLRLIGQIENLAKDDSFRISSTLKLHDAQTRFDIDWAQSVELNADKSAEERWLMEKHVYLAKWPSSRTKSASNGRLDAITLISTHSRHTEGEREAISRVIENALAKTSLDPIKHAIVSCRKAFRPVEGFENEPSEFLVTFSVEKFSDAVKLPEAIASSKVRLTIGTLLSTTRYQIWSDQARLRHAHE